MKFYFSKCQITSSLGGQGNNLFVKEGRKKNNNLSGRNDCLFHNSCLVYYTNEELSNFILTKLYFWFLNQVNPFTNSIFLYQK